MLGKPEREGPYRKTLLQLVVVLERLGAALLLEQDMAEGADHAQVVQAHQRIAQAGGFPGRQHGRRAACCVPGGAPVQRLPAGGHGLQHTRLFVSLTSSIF